jgi:hypothetical protein
MAHIQSKEYDASITLCFLLLDLITRNFRLGLFSLNRGMFGWLQAGTVAAVWTAVAAIHREKNTVEAAAVAAASRSKQAACFASEAATYCHEYSRSGTRITRSDVVAVSARRRVQRLEPRTA